MVLYDGYGDVMSPPIVIIHDMKEYTPETLPDEYLVELKAELQRETNDKVDQRFYKKHTTSN